MVRISTKLIAGILPIALATGAAQAGTPLEKIWYSGNQNNKFLIDFTGENPTVTCGKPIGQSGGFEGTANFTDPSSGKLRLYTDGITVFNGQTNQPLENGTRLAGNSSAGEAAMIVPVVGTNPNLFYIFTNKIGSVYFSIADLSKGVNGTVTLKNQLLASRTGEALGVVPHTNGRDFWVLVFDTAAKLSAYKVDSSGVARLPVVSNTGFSGNIARSSIIYSPDYNTLSLGWAARRIATAKIDRSTGSISNIEVRVTGQVGYSTAFSPDGSKLYYTYGYQGYLGTPWQLDLSNGNKIKLSNFNKLGGPKLADNSKIYWTGIKSLALSIVNNPNAAGTAANFSLNSLSLNGCKGSYNLPNQTASSIHFVEKNTTCNTKQISEAYTRTGAGENLVAPFTSPATSTTKSYSGLAEVIVSGTGISLGNTLNDAFFGVKTGKPLDPQYYQLNIGWNAAPLKPYAGESRNIANFIKFVDGMGKADLPTYNSNNRYHFVIEVPKDAGRLSFGVSDGGFDDNTGQYNLEVYPVKSNLPASCSK